MRTLKLGCTGEEVRMLQERLLDEGFSVGPAEDGLFGGGTKAALLAYQRAAGLLPDGIAGPRTLCALDLADAADSWALPSVLGEVTQRRVESMFPDTAPVNITRNLPFVLRALEEAELWDRPMVLMALATIRAETESFLPIDEQPSRYNTSPMGAEFDLYDFRRDLGNGRRGDGRRYRGRGYIQLTGKSNYLRYGKLIGLDSRLFDQPELANDPEVAARVLARFLGERERRIKESLLDGDLRSARRIVNGGTHGMGRFKDAYTTGLRVIPEVAG